MSYYQPHTIILTAGERLPLSVSGRYFRVLQGTGTLSVIVDDNDVADFIQRGMGFTVENGFESLAFESPTSQTIIVGVSDTRIDDDRLTLDADVTLTKGQTNNSYSIALTSSGVSIAADTARRSLLIQNKSASDIEYGEAGFTLGDGIVINPNGAATIDESAAAAWDLDTAAAGPLDVRILEELD